MFSVKLGLGLWLHDVASYCGFILWLHIVASYCGYGDVAS